IRNFYHLHSRVAGRVDYPARPHYRLRLLQTDPSTILLATFLMAKNDFTEKLDNQRERSDFFFDRSFLLKIPFKSLLIIPRRPSTRTSSQSILINRMASKITMTAASMEKWRPPTRRS